LKAWRRLHAGSGLTLEPVAPSHAPEIFSITSAERPRLRVWLPWVDKTRRVADSRAAARSCRANARAGKELRFVLKRRGRIVGLIGLSLDLANLKGSVGYWLREEATGKGLATAACRRLIAHAFRELRLNRVKIRCGTGNARSRGVPERLGLKLEGILRQAERIGDRFVDHAVYSVLASEWPPKGPRR
jgi:ribosomal-protein-serine acetyltransferase